MEFEKYLAKLQKEFARYGHIAYPLTKNEVRIMLALNTNEDKAYRVACDVATGFHYVDALVANLGLSK